MSQNLPIVLHPPTFGSGYCPSPQQLANDIASGMTAYVEGGYMFFNYGSTQPIPDDQNKPWLRINNDGTPDRWYVYANGAWLWPHPTSPSSSERRMWAGLEADLVNYDGGSTGSITDSTGPMWEVDHDFDARFPLGPGTLTGAGVVAVGATGGVETITLDVTQMPPHTHNFPLYAGDAVNHSSTRINTTDENTVINPSFPTSNTGGDPATGTPPTSAKPFSVLPPYKAVFMIKRTSRKFFAV